MKAMKALVALLVSIVACAGVAEAQVVLRVAPDLTPDGVPGTAVPLVFNLRGVRDYPGGTLEISVIQSPLQGYAIDPGRFPLDRAGTGSGSLRVVTPAGSDPYGVWRFRASARVGERTVTAEFTINFRLSLRQDRYGTVAQAPIGRPVDLAGITVLNDAGRGVAGVQVEWEATGPERSSGRVASDERGQVRIPLRVTRPGTYEVVARLARRGEVFTGEAKFYVSTGLTLRRAGPESRGGVPGEPVSPDLEVSVVDTAGQPVSGIPIDWQIIAQPGGADARLTGGDERTRQGTARMRVALGDKVGAYRVEARIPRESGQPALSGDVAVFEIQTLPARELEERLCRTAREALPGLTREYQAKAAAYEAQVQRLRGHESVTQAALRRLMGAIDQADQFQYDMRLMVEALEREVSRGASVMGWSAFLHQFGSTLAKVAHAAKAVTQYAAGELTRDALKHLGIEVGLFEVFEHVAEQFGPERARTRWRSVVEARDAALDARQRIVQNLVELSRQHRAQQAAGRQRAEGLAHEANRLAGEANAAARSLRDRRDEYRSCEDRLVRAGARREELFGSWPNGRSDRDTYVQQNVPPVDRVAARGW